MENKTNADDDVAIKTNHRRPDPAREGALMSQRVGPRMAALAAYVDGHPNCSMLDAARAVGPNGSLQFGYRIAHRAVAARIVYAIKGVGRYRLYPIARMSEP